MDNKEEVITTEVPAVDTAKMELQTNSSMDVASLASSEKPKPKPKSKAKLILLSIGVVVLIAIAIVLIVVLTTQNNGEPTQSDVSAQDEKVSQTRENIQQAYDEEGDIDNLIERYNEEIEIAKENEDYDLANRLIDGRSFDLYDYGRCDLAIEFLKSEDVSMFEPENLATFYNIAEGKALTCGDDENREMWQKLYGDIMSGVEPMKDIENE